MRSWFEGRWRRLVVLAAVVGPGIITANVDNDAGGITTYSLAGAIYGYRLLWTVIPVALALFVVQEMSSRLGVVTGKGLADLMREEFGVKATFYLMVALLVTNWGNTMAEFAGLAAALEIVHVPRLISVPIGAVFVWWLVTWGTYRAVEKVFLLASAFYVSYVISGIMAKPDWGNVLASTVTPSFEANLPFVVMVIGIVGTTIAPWMQFYQQAAVVEKGIPTRNLREARLDVAVGSVMAVIVVWFIVISCGATLHRAGIPIKSAADAAHALAPLAGRYAALLFGFGLFNASLFAAAILPLSTAYSVCEGMGWERGIDKKLNEAPWFYGIYTALIALGAGAILVPGVPLLKVLYLSQVANGILLPAVLLFMLILANRRDLMGENVNSRTFNFVAWVLVGSLIVMTLFLSVATLLGLG
ncbi:MAG TPA: Nramp family divalent metal transporter [Thermoanaerobaculaceae bacterium]|nr:Nramp family divalent metal transporter [Thermoanaerobaculaceae bacterium]